jgi:hypothetical protein
MSEGEGGIRQAKLKRNNFKEFLQNRYSRQVGEKILVFLESFFNSLYKIDYSGYLGVLMEMLNAGPESYRKMLFVCLSKHNPGRICEHDVFSLIEQFK